MAEPLASGPGIVHLGPVDTVRSGPSPAFVVHPGQGVLVRAEAPGRGLEGGTASCLRILSRSVFTEPELNPNEPLHIQKAPLNNPGLPYT